MAEWRDALIADALSDGALAGFQAGLVNTAMDTAVNLAATKIPYISGFVELAQIAYDPEAWLQAQSQATFGKFSVGFDQIMNGDGWDARLVYTGGGSPRQLALDLANRHIYFADGARPAIYRVDLSGANETLVIDDVAGQFDAPVDGAGMHDQQVGIACHVIE